MTFGLEQAAQPKKGRPSKSQPKSNLKKEGKKGGKKKQVEFDSDKNEEFEFQEHHNTDVKEE